MQYKGIVLVAVTKTAELSDFFCFPLSDRGKTSPKLTESVPHHPGSLAIQQFKYYKYILIDYIYMVFPICPILDAIWEFATPMGVLFGNLVICYDQVQYQIFSATDPEVVSILITLPGKGSPFTIQ